MSGDSFDEYMASDINIPRSNSAEMADDESSIIYESIEDGNYPKDALYDLTESGEEQSDDESVENRGEGVVAEEANDPFVAPGLPDSTQQTTPVGQGGFAVPLTSGHREFLLRMNETASHLPGVNLFSIPAADHPQRQPHLQSPFKLDNHAGHGRMGRADSESSVAAGESASEQGGVSLRFNSVHEANVWSQQSVQTAIDISLPQTQEDRKNIVRALLAAMASVDSAQDNDGMIKPFLERKYSKDRMEAACWNVLERCIQRHTQGPLLASYDVKTKQTSKIDDFGTRMGHIIDAIRSHKTICKHLLDAPYLLAFVEDPVGSKNRVVANKALNKRKGEVMVAGKEALGQTPTSGARGRPRKTPTTKKEKEPKSGAGSAPRAKKTPRATTRGRTDSNVSSVPSGYLQAGMSSLTMESPTPASHSALRTQRNLAQTGSPGQDVGGNPGRMTANPYDPSLVSGAGNPQSSPFNPNPGPGARPRSDARRPSLMGPPPTTPASTSKAEKKTASSSRGKKRTKRDSDDQEYAPTPHKKGHR